VERHRVLLACRLNVIQPELFLFRFVPKVVRLCHQVRPPGMALKFCLGMVAIGACSSCRGNCTCESWSSLPPVNLVELAEGPSVAWLIQKRWNLLSILLSTLLHRALALGAFLARFDPSWHFLHLELLRRVADSAYHGGRCRYGHSHEAGTVNSIARRCTCGRDFCPCHSTISRVCCRRNSR
jgi:hypothetical protein